MPRISPYPPRFERGFTLLEMLVVMTVLAALGGAVLVATGNLREGALRQAAQMEMQKIKQALLQYRLDRGAFHAPASPADFDALYTQGAQPVWDAATARGWRGPYLTALGEGLVDIGDNLQSNGSGSPSVIDVAPRIEQRGVADPFVALAVANGGYVPCDAGAPDNNCLLDWRTLSGNPRHSRWGRPYLLFDLDDPARARLVGMGPDGRYDGVNGTDVCAPNNDDLVLCLLR